MGKQLKEMISLSKVIPLVIGRAYIWSQGTKTPSWGFCPLHYIFPLIQLSSAPLTCSAALIKYVEGWADWRIHGLKGVWFGFGFLRLQAKFLRSPSSRIVFLSPSLVIIVKNKLSRVGSDTSWLSRSVAESYSKEPSPGQKQRSVFLVNPGYKEKLAWGF